MQIFFHDSFFVSNQQSKTAQIFIYHHKWQREAVKPDI